jgi:hypothetical protein
MSKLEDLQPNASLRGTLPDSLVTVVSVQWFGRTTEALSYDSLVQSWPEVIRLASEGVTIPQQASMFTLGTE